MGPNHTDRLGDGDRVPGNQRTYREILDQPHRQPEAAPARSTWSTASGLALVAVSVVALASIGAGLAVDTSAAGLVWPLRLVALVAAAVGMAAGIAASHRRAAR